MLVYRLILDNPDRTVQFARSSGIYANELGFGNYLVMQGLTRKLTRDSVVETPTIKRVPGEGFVDIATTEVALERVRGTGGAHQEEQVDRPAVDRHSLPLHLVGHEPLGCTARHGRHGGRQRHDGTREGASRTAVGLTDILGQQQAVRPVAPLPILADTAIRPSVPAKPTKKQGEKKQD